MEWWERLAADFRRHPARDHGDESGGAHEERESQQRARVVEPLPRARHQARDAEQQHDA